MAAAAAVATGRYHLVLRGHRGSDGASPLAAPSAAAAAAAAAAIPASSRAVASTAGARVWRGTVAFEPRRLLRYEVVSHIDGDDGGWGLIWGHGLSSSMRSESEGGWPFASVLGLADMLPVARFDARGHGTSDSAADACSTWPAMGRDLALLRQTWGRRRTILGGTSMGAAASLFAALELHADEGLAGLILATPPTCHETRRKLVPMYREGLEATRRSGLEAARCVAAAKTRPPIFQESEFGRAMFDLGWEEKMRMGSERYCAALEGACASDLPPIEALQQIRVPTLILAWASDVQHPVSSAVALAGALPNSELHVAKTWSEIEAFPEHMRTFISRLRRPMGY